MAHYLPKCKKCGNTMYFQGYASMGGSHSNYYECSKCKRVVEIYDRDLPYYDSQPQVVLPQKYKKF